MVNTLLLAFALMLVIEGLLPFLIIHRCSAAVDARRIRIHVFALGARLTAAESQSGKHNQHGKRFHNRVVIGHLEHEAE